MDLDKALEMAIRCGHEFPDKAQQTPLVVLGQEIKRLREVENVAANLLDILQDLLEDSACGCGKRRCPRCSKEKAAQKFLKKNQISFEYHDNSIFDDPAKTGPIEMRGSGGWGTSHW